MLEGKKLSEAIEDKLVVALGGDRKLANDFIKRKREGEGRESICDSPATRCETYIMCFPYQPSYMQQTKVWTLYPTKVSDLLTAIVNNENRTIVGTLVRKASLAIQLYSLRRQTRQYVDLLINDARTPNISRRVL
jgi:hypothetical protein